MTIVQTTNKQNSSGQLSCPSCNAMLPPYARFCGVCGKRIAANKQQAYDAQTNEPNLSLNNQTSNIATHINGSNQNSTSQMQTYTSSTRTQDEQALDEVTNEDTIRMVSLSLKDLARWRSSRHQKPEPESDEPQASPTLQSERDRKGRTNISTLNFNMLTNQSPWLLARSLVQRLHRDSLIRNGFFIMGTGVATAGFGYLYWILATHAYSVYDVGLASALISAMALASTIANLGVGSTLVQTLPRRESGHDWSLTLNAGLAIGILAGLLAGAAVVVILPLLSPQFAIVEQQAGYAFTLLVGVPIMTLSTLLDQAFIAERASINMLIRNLAVAVLKIPLMVLPVILLAHVGALGILLSGVLAMAVMLSGGMVLLIPRLRRAYCLAVRGIVGQIRSMLSSLAGHYFINLGGLTSQYLLPVFVAVQLSPTANAYFYTTMKISDFFFMTSSAVAVSLFAEGSHAASNLPHKVRSSIMIIGSLLVPAMIVCFFGGRYIMSIFGPSYAQNGQELFRIYIVAAIPDAITNIYISVLRVQRRLRFAAVLNVGMAVITLGLAWIFLPVFGIAGAGWAFLISQTAGTLTAGIDFIRLRYYRNASDRATIQNGSDRAETEDT
jgi:O-antigen/teichoic acid export membrane protein